MRKLKRRLGLIFVFTVLVVLNQNCGGGFQSLDQSTLNTNLGNPGSSTTSTTQPPTSTSSTTTTLATTTTTTLPATTTTTMVVTTTTTLPTSTTVPPFTGDVKIMFPPPSATSEATMVVRGVSRSGAGVTEVSVNGVAATSSDGFLSWQATVPLIVGANNLVVDLRKGSATYPNSALVAVQRFSAEGSITRGTGTWGGGRLNGMDFESAVNRMLLTDDVHDGVWGVQLATGNRVLVADSASRTHGTGWDFTFATGISVYNRTALVMDTSILVNVDTVTGDRAVYLEVRNPDGSFREVASLIRGSPDGLTYVLLARTAILKINAVTKAITEIPLTGGTGPSVSNPATVDVAWKQNKAIVMNYSGDQVVSVDLTSGVRQLLSGAASGALKIEDPTKIAVDEDTNQVFFWDRTRLVAVDLTTGARRITGNVGPLLNLSAIKAISMTPYGPAILDHLQDYEGGPRSPTLILIDPIIGTRVILSR